MRQNLLQNDLITQKNRLNTQFENRNDRIYSHLNKNNDTSKSPNCRQQTGNYS